MGRYLIHFHRDVYYIHESVIWDAGWYIFHVDILNQ